MDIDMAADVAADVAFFFKLGHYNGPFFSPLYFLAQTRPFIWIPKNLAHQTSTIPGHFLKFSLQPKTSHKTHAKNTLQFCLHNKLNKNSVSTLPAWFFSKKIYQADTVSHSITSNTTSNTNSEQYIKQHNKCASSINLIDQTLQLCSIPSSLVIMQPDKGK